MSLWMIYWSRLVKFALHHYARVVNLREKMSEHGIFKGLPTCLEQVNSFKEDVESWSGVRYNSNNAWYANLSNGNVNNNNTYNRYYAPLASDSCVPYDRFFEAEEYCFANKHDSMDAVKMHHNLSDVVKIANEVTTDTYTPSTSICFVNVYPKYREVFAANYRDRIVHHYVAGFINEIAEKVHVANGDVSHGNRIGHSAQTYAEQIQQNINKTTSLYGKDVYIATIDFSAFFMSLDKQKVCECISRYADMYYEGEDKEEKLHILPQLIMHDPTTNCERRSPASMWAKVPKHKSLFHAGGKGLPIGNFYSQLLANLFRASIDAEIRKYVLMSAFVDDITMVGTLEQIRKAKAAAREEAERLCLTINEKKTYCQPARHGVKTCGRVIRGNRIYISNRVVHNARLRITELAKNVCKESAADVVRSINSYHGLMCHCQSFNKQKELADEVLQSFSKYVYFRKRRSMLVATLKQEYTNRHECLINIINYKNKNYEVRKNNQRYYRSKRSRKRERRACQPRLEASVRATA